MNRCDYSCVNIWAVNPHVLQGTLVIFILERHLTVLIEMKPTSPIFVLIFLEYKLPEELRHNISFG